MSFDNREQLIRDFHKNMVAVYHDALNGCNYRAKRFIAMVHKIGGYEAAKRLLAASDLAYGLRQLALCGRLDISMEALILRTPWSTLFTAQELEIAQNRLKELRYQP